MIKKKILFIVLIIAITGIVSAIDFDLGLNYGFRTINDTSVKDNFGNGSVYNINGSINIIKNFSLGIGYEGGFSRTAEIGLNKDKSKLELAAFKIFGAYRFKIKKIISNMKFGLDFFSYEQKISSFNKTIDGNKLGFFIAAGIKFYPINNFYISAEINYIFLNINPINKDVNMGGFCINTGIGYIFHL